MDISRSIKDFFLIAPYFLMLIIYVILNTITRLFFGFMGLMIFIYERLKWN